MDTPKVMGILNLTTDSFYDGGCFVNENAFLRQAEKMIKEGADFIDLGAYSTRPGADDIPESTEISKIVSATDALQKNFPETFISVDTFRSSVAKNAVEHGAVMINDISGGTLDKNMFNCVAQLEVSYVLMHMRGNPATMKNFTQYDNLLEEILVFFQEQVYKLKNLGVKDIIIDPGFGFAKTIGQNYELLKNLHYFEILELPVLAGLSRKSTIYKSLDTTPENALNGTTVLNTIALVNGANILRVHDVKEAVETVKLYNLTYH